MFMADKAAIIGPESIIIGFKAFGFEAFFAENNEQAKEHLKNIIHMKEFTIVFVAAKLAHNIQPEINNASKYFTVTILPANQKEEEWADDHIKSISEKATGVDIWGKLN